jgi:hypothetical protein
MGFHDVDWAYGIDRPLAETAVLAALCHRTDDATHETFVGQQVIAEMIGSSPEKVLRALKALELAGVISRTRRNGPAGYRTSDLIRVNVDTYLTNRLLGEPPTRQNAYQENRRDLPDDSSAPTWQKVTAEEITQIDHSGDHSVNPHTPDRFEEFWEAWPRKVAKPKAKESWLKATRRADPSQIIAAAIAYRDNPGRPEIRLIPHPTTWLNQDRWNDALEDHRPGISTDRARQRQDANLAVVARLSALDQADQSGLTALERAGFKASLELTRMCDQHPHYPLEINGSCTRCEREQQETRGAA